MAIWQYKLFAIPEEELKSYFNNSNFIFSEDYNSISWWKYRTYTSTDFSSFRNLPFSESWTKEIILLGEIDSDCIEIILEKKKICEVSIRVDLRKDYKIMVDSICTFGQNNNLYFLNDKFKLLPSLNQFIIEDIEDNDRFKRFIANISDS